MIIEYRLNGKQRVVNFYDGIKQYFGFNALAKNRLISTSFVQDNYSKSREFYLHIYDLELLFHVLDYQF